MAYEIKYLFKFESSNGTTREIRVLQDGYTGEVIQRPLGRAPVLKKQQNGPVHGTSLEFYAECHVDREFIEFYTSDPKAYRVDLYAGATLLWQGYITPELYSEPDIAPPYDVRVVATDGVGELKLYDYAAQGAVTLRALLSGLLARTGLGTDVYLISSLKAGSRGAGALLDMTINLDYMAGKTCYETLTYILDTLHATITWWKGAWILTRETNVTFTNGKVRYFNTAGNSALLADSVQTLGSLRANPAWPVGQLSTVIDPAKNRVAVQAPWHVVTCLQNSDMTSDAGWAKSNDASYGPDGYLFPNNDEGTGTYATAYISQALAMEGLRVPMSFELRATGVSAQVGVRVGAAIGVLLTYTVGDVVYHLRKGSEGTPEWTPGPTIGTSIDGSLVDYQRPLASFDMDRIQAETLQITDIPAFVQGTSYPAGTLTVYILGTCARVYAATLDVILPKGYQDILRIDNGARGEGSEVEVAIGRETADNAYYAAFLQGLLLDSGNLITSFSDANFPAGMDYLAFIARDYALSVALPRAKVTGTVYLESGIAAPPLVFTKGALNYWLQTWSWNLKEDELEIDALTLPSASLTVESETILESNGSTVSSADSAGSSGPSSSMGVGINYFELATDPTLVQLRQAYSYLGPRKGLIFDANAEADTNADFEKVVLPGGGYALHSKLPFYSDSFISAGGISSGGGAAGGNATLVAQTYGGTLSATGIDGINFYSKERVDQLLLTAGKVQTVAGIAPTSGDIPVASLKSALGLGAAAAYGIGSVASGSTGLVTGGSVYSAINEAVSSVMKMQGTTTTPLSDGSTTNPVVIDGSSYTAKKGDVVLYDGKEYLWAGGAWEQLGDEASWALKTTSISAGTGLTGGGSLASNRTISLSDSTIASLTLANTALQSVAFSDLTSHPTTLSGYAISDAKIDGGVITLGGNTITPVTGVKVGGSGHTNELAITSGGTTNHITVPFATSATTASKLSTVSKTIWGVTYWTSGGVPTNVTGRPTLYIARTQVNTSAANDTLLGITAISNAASSGSSDKSRVVWDADHDAWHFLGNVYADGFISAGGLSSGGGAEGVSLAAVWASLKTNSDDYANEKINAYHIPIGSGLSVVNGLIVANNAGAVTSVKVGTTTYNPTDGVVSLPAYPTIPTNVSAFTNDAGYLTAHQSLDGYVNALTRTPSSGGNYVSAVTKSGKTLTVTYATLPTALKNPNALTFGSKTYDGSAARTITASDLGALTAHQTVTLASGTNNGTLKLTTAAGVTDNIAVTGLKALAYKSLLAFSELTGTPTTLSGYGISDAMRVIVLEDNGTTTAGTWLAKSNPSSLITGYTDGLVVLYKITVAGASTTTLNINGIGAKTVYRVGTSKLTTHYPVGSYILLYYAAGIGRGSFQVLSDYDANSDTYLRMYPTTGDVEYPLLARYYTTSGSSYYTEYGRYAVGVTLNPHEKSITASKFIVTGGASSGFLKADGSVDSNSYALASALGGYYTKSETDAQISAAIDALPEPMIFKGSLGTGGTITTLPAASSANTGFTYKVITAGTYQSVAAKVGDTFISTGSLWVLIPSGDEPSGTVTSVGLSVPTGLSVSGSPITTSGTFKISFAAGYSIPTTTKQTAWDAKYDKPSTGIPQTDLASALSTKVNHGENAYNSLGDYLPLAGGTMSGALTISTSGYGNQLVIKRNNHNYDAVIRFENATDGLLGYIGIRGSVNNTVPAYSDGTNVYTLYHSGNSNLSTVDWTAKQMTANSFKLASGTPTLTWDANANAWHLSGNFYADGFISAGGISPGGGSGGIDPEAMWQLLGDSTNEQIAASHLTTALMGYLPLAGGTMSNTNVVTNLNADLLDGYHTSTSNTPWGTIPVINANGWMDIGKHLEFHFDNSPGIDYSTVLQCTGNWTNVVALPSASGTLALMSDLSAYVAKSGDTMTGSLTIDNIDGSFIKNIKYSSTSGWARNIVDLTVDGVSKFVIGALGDYIAGASNNGITYAYIGVNSYDGANLRFGSDSTLKWGTYSIYHQGNLSLSTLAGSTQIGSSTQPVYYNGSALVATDLSTTYAPYNSAGYLPLNGGRMSGDITLGDYHKIQFGGGESSVYGDIHFGSDNWWLYFNRSGSDYLVWTAGNDGSGSGLDADLLDGYHASISNTPWGTIPVLNSSGFMDVGKHFEFHYDNTTGSDYSTILQCTGNYSNIVSLPSGTGTLALTTDNVASATQLQTSRSLWGNSFNGTADINGSITITPYGGVNAFGGYLNLRPSPSQDTLYAGLKYDVAGSEALILSTGFSNAAILFCPGVGLGTVTKDSNYVMKLVPGEIIVAAPIALYREINAYAPYGSDYGLRYIPESSWGAWARSALQVYTTNDIVNVGAYGEAGTQIDYGFFGWSYDNSYAIRVYEAQNPTVGSNMIYHAGNSNLSTVPWACSTLTASGNVSVAGSISHTGTIYVNESASNTDGGIAFWGKNGRDLWGLFMSSTSGYGTHGAVSGDYAVYFTMDNTAGRGWIWRNLTTGPVASLNSTGNFVANGAITAGSASDARLKTNIQSLSAEAAKHIVMALNPVTFTWNSTATELYDQYKGDDLGFIAQEVEPYLPQAIGTIFEKYMRLDQTKVIAPLVKVAQDHETRIRQLERENAELKRRLNMN